MFDFEKLHRNHKWAFIDGLLSGAVVVGLVSYMKYRNLEEKHERDIEEAEYKTRDETFSSAFQDGYREGKIHMRPYVDVDRYRKMYTQDPDYS